MGSGLKAGCGFWVLSWHQQVAFSNRVRVNGVCPGPEWISRVVDCSRRKAELEDLRRELIEGGAICHGRFVIARVDEVSGKAIRAFCKTATLVCVKGCC